MSAKSFKVSFTLDESDANYFRKLFREAKKAAKDKPADTILAGAADLVERVRATKKAPKFVLEAIASVEDLTQIVTDADYDPPKSVTVDVLGALVVDEVVLEVAGELDPGVIKPAADQHDFVGVIMPMRI